MTSQDYHIIKKLLDSPKNIAIISHVNPDGDSIGSSLALYNLLIQENHNVNVVIPNRHPEFLSFMHGNDKITIYTEQAAQSVSVLENANIIFCVDFNDAKRVRKLSDTLKKSKATKILIDHHIESKNFCDFVIIDTNVSSAAELVYSFIINLNKKYLINKAIAECLYVGIITDTGSFSYSLYNEKTFLVAAELIKYGIDGCLIHNLVYDNNSENRIKLLGFSLSEKMKVIPEYSTAYIILSKNDLRKFNHQIGDTEGLVNYPLSIKNIIISALFTENNKNIRISFRSKGDLSVNDIAKHFDGGGHKNAAGATSWLTMDETISKFEKILADYKEKLSPDNE